MKKWFIYMKQITFLKSFSEASICVHPEKQFSPSLPTPTLKCETLNVWVVCGKRHLLTAFALVFFEVTQGWIMFSQPRPTPGPSLTIPREWETPDVVVCGSSPRADRYVGICLRISSLSILPGLARLLSLKLPIPYYTPAPLLSILSADI